MSSRQLRYTSVDFREQSTPERAIWTSSAFKQTWKLWNQMETPRERTQTDDGSRAGSCDIPTFRHAEDGEDSAKETQEEKPLRQKENQWNKSFKNFFQEEDDQPSQKLLKGWERWRLSGATGFNDLEVTADLDDTWLGRMAGMEARECVEVGGSVQRLETANKDDSPNNFAVKKWDGGWRREERLKEKMLLKVGIRRVLCGWGRSSAAAEFTLNSKVLLWWCRQIRVIKKRPTLVHNEFCEKAFSKTSFKKEENNEINSNNGINTVTVSRLKGVLCYPNSSKLALEGASPAEPAQL